MLLKAKVKIKSRLNVLPIIILVGSKHLLLNVKVNLRKE